VYISGALSAGLYCMETRILTLQRARLSSTAGFDISGWDGVGSVHVRARITGAIPMFVSFNSTASGSRTRPRRLAHALEAADTFVSRKNVPRTPRDAHAHPAGDRKAKATPHRQASKNQLDLPTPPPAPTASRAVAPARRPRWHDRPAAPIAARKN
jgi:hypothetical protein